MWGSGVYGIVYRSFGRSLGSVGFQQAPKAENASGKP